MGEPENKRIHEILHSMPPERRLFRINAGQGWVGEIVPTRRRDLMVLKNPRPLHAAPDGWPDLCGWESVVITPEMVGQRVAVFVGCEVKATGPKRLKPGSDQDKFRSLITRMGGIFEIG